MHGRETRLAKNAQAIEIKGVIRPKVVIDDSVASRASADSAVYLKGGMDINSAKPADEK